MNEIEQLNREISFCEKQLMKLPEGKLSASKGAKGYSYFYTADGKQKYIYQENEALALALAKRYVYEKRISLAEQKKKDIEKYLTKSKTTTIEEYMSGHEGILRLLENNGAAHVLGNHKGAGVSLLLNTQWVDAVAQDANAYQILKNSIFYDKNHRISWNYDGRGHAGYQEERTVKTICGINVRSKSEAIEANALYKAGILFVYEPDIILDGKTVNPDFYVFHPINGSPAIIEHGGLFYDRDRIYEYSEKERRDALNYTNTFAFKLQGYVRNGWIPNINLFITSETKYRKLDSMEIERIIENYLFQQ